MFAFRIEICSSNSMSGFVHVSEATYSRIRADSPLKSMMIPREVSVKGKGVMNTYLLEAARASAAEGVAAALVTAAAAAAAKN